MYGPRLGARVIAEPWLLPAPKTVVLKALSPGFEPFVVAAAEAAEAAGHGAAFDVTTMLGGFD